LFNSLFFYTLNITLTQKLCHAVAAALLALPKRKKLLKRRNKTADFIYLPAGRQAEKH
jgi:hypothetical protein